MKLISLAIIHSALLIIGYSLTQVKIGVTLILYKHKVKMKLPKMEFAYNMVKKNLIMFSSMILITNMDIFKQFSSRTMSPFKIKKKPYQSKEA